MRILIAEDDPVSHRLLQLTLERFGHDVVMAADGDEAWAVLQSPDCPRLAVLDWMMPGIDGPEICRRVRAMARQDYVYIILLTARTHNADIVEGLTAGADDFIGKPFRADELQARIRTAMRILDLQQQLVANNIELERRATHDGLTGIYNRTAIFSLLGRELNRAMRVGSVVSVVLLDIDHFKYINDSLGHQTGDQVLREVSRRIEDAIRPYDTVGRYGGEEFLVVLADCDVGIGASVAERIRTGLLETPILVGPSEMVQVTVSLGVADSRVEKPTTDDLVRRADEAMYRAKSRGRNLTVLWSPVQT